MTDARIIIDAGSSSGSRLLTKFTTYSDGGFGVLMPYHEEKQGWLAKVPVDYHKKQWRAKPEECEEYTATDRAKLSYHGDGFAQFSGERSGRITSGRDPDTGEPKGLGLMTSPILTPIESGPSVAIACWGIEHFDKARNTRKTDIRFAEHDWYFRSPPDKANGYLVEAFVLPRHMWAAVRRDPSRDYVLRLGHDAFAGHRGVLEYRVLPLVGEAGFLALSAHRVRMNFDTPSGYTLNGPGMRNEDGTGVVLVACYPKMWGTEAAKPLDRPVSE